MRTILFAVLLLVTQGIPALHAQDKLPPCGTKCDERLLTGVPGKCPAKCKTLSGPTPRTRNAGNCETVTDQFEVTTKWDEYTYKASDGKTYKCRETAITLEYSGGGGSPPNSHTCP